MAGPSVGFAYDADLYLSRPDYTAAARVTWYNDCQRWPAQCKPNGAQLSRLDWKGDGTALFFGLWIHESVTQPAASSELHRLDFVGRCG